MPMDRRTAAGTIFATISAGGIAAMIGMTALPTGSPYFDSLIYVGVVAIAVGFLGLFGLLIWPGKKEALPPLPEPERVILPSVFLRVSDSAQVHIEDSLSTADTFIDATGTPRIASVRNSHEPRQRSADRPEGDNP